MKGVRTFLWFQDQAEEAARYYVSIFKDAQILETMPGPGGKAMCATFRIGAQEFMAFNGGPHNRLSPAVSIFVSVETQAEVDELWEKLLADGGHEDHCGWLIDRFGLSWQIIPTALGRLISAPDRAKADRAFQAMLKMVKIDIAELESAFEGR